MSKYYAISFIHHTNTFVTKNGQAIACVCSGMGSKDTLIYKRKANAEKTIQKIQKKFNDQLTIIELNTVN